MLKNLRAEQIRQDVSDKKIAEILNIRENTVKEKIKNGRFSISQCHLVIALFQENNSIDYLFKRY